MDTSIGDAVATGIDGGGELNYPLGVGCRWAEGSATKPACAGWQRVIKFATAINPG